jgi:uncharacterized surface protein with fasciclin (FAS1) repeats
MRVKNLMLASTAAIACTLGATAQAAPPGMAECLAVPITQFDGTVVDAALATPELSTLVDALVAAGLVDALNDAEDVTVYAPTNDAFAAIPGDILGAIVGDEGLLTAVLTYHVTAGTNDPRSFVPPVRRDTLLGQKVYYAYADGAPRVNNAAVNCSGVQTSNGIVWLIDSVLIPGL